MKYGGIRIKVVKFGWVGVKLVRFGRAEYFESLGLAGW